MLQAGKSSEDIYYRTIRRSTSQHAHIHGRPEGRRRVTAGLERATAWPPEHVLLTLTRHGPLCPSDDSCACVDLIGTWPLAQPVAWGNVLANLTNPGYAATYILG